MLARHHADLTDLAARDRLRVLAPRAGIDFASNDYLGLAASERLKRAAADALARGVPVGSGGSRLLRGNHAEHVALEAEAAAFFSGEAALFVANGYVANVALLATLPQRGDLIVHDALIHASAHDGMRLSRAERIAAGHNDVAAIERAIGTWRAGGGDGRVWIAVESLYSMDGDRAPLADLAALAQREAAFLLIDEAHATGVFGDGRGLVAEYEGRPDVVTLHGCGKALGVEGALLCLPVILRDSLVNRARGFVFSTAPSPLIAATVRESLRAIADEPDRRTRLHALIAQAARALGPHGVTATDTPILPLVLGDDARTMAKARALQAAGYDVRGIRPPTVPEGTARLRISVTLNVDADDIDGLAQAVATS